LTDNNGQANFTVQGDLRRILRVNQQLVDFWIVYPGSLLVTDNPANYAVSPVSKAGLTTLSVALGVTVDLSSSATTGMIAFQAYDCGDRQAAGIQYALEPAKVTPNTKTWYMVSSVPSFGTDATDSSGTGGIINVPPNAAVLVTATRKADGVVVGTHNVIVRAGWITLVWTRPRAPY